MSISHKSWLMFSAAVLLTPGAAFAQSAQPVPSSADAKADNGGLEEIVVTAQQRGENLQKAAVPLSVVTGEELLKSGIIGVETLQKSVPALQVANGATGNFIFIRGVGSFSPRSSRARFIRAWAPM